MATLALDVVVEQGETAEQAARYVAGKHADKVTISVRPAGNGWPEATYTGDEAVLKSIKHRYDTLGNNKGRNLGLASVAKGEKRNRPAKGTS